MRDTYFIPVQYIYYEEYLVSGDNPEFLLEVPRTEDELAHPRVVAGDEGVVDVRQQPQLVVVERHQCATTSLESEALLTFHYKSSLTARLTKVSFGFIHSFHNVPG